MMPVELDVKGLYKQNAPLLVTDYVIGEHTQVHANTIILKCEPTVWSLYGKEDKTATLDIQKTKTPTPPTSPVVRTVSCLEIRARQSQCIWGKREKPFDDDYLQVQSGRRPICDVLVNLRCVYCKQFVNERNTKRNCLL